MERILDGLNEAQKAAVSSPAAVVQVLAPPGSGKTKTLTARVAYLISNKRYSPRNIIVCTFTVKAAREMKDRIQGFLGAELSRSLILGTFHSIARRFLVAYGHKIGIDAAFGIADSSDSFAIIRRIVKRLHLSIDPAKARSRISRLKAQSMSPEAFSASQKTIEQQEFATVYFEYEEHLRVSNLLDYDDLLLRCADLLRRCPSCVENIQAVLIDEFQDTNNVQYDLMQLFSQRQSIITIVGDPDQSIYGFRSAEIKNLKRMQDQYPKTHVAILSENYRSSGSILMAAMQVIEQDQSRPQKDLSPTHGVGMSPVLRRLPSAAVEAIWLVSEVQRSVSLTGGLFNYSDFAILLRSASLSRLIEAALGKAGIPYRMVGGHKFFDRMEVKLLLDYLRVLDHPNHNDAVSRVLNVPSRKIGDVTVHALLANADERKIPLWTVVLDVAQGRKTSGMNISSQAQKGLEAFVNLILTSRKKLMEFSKTIDDLPTFLNLVVDKIGLKEYLNKSKAEDFEARWANVQELIAQASGIASQSAEDDFRLDVDLTVEIEESVAVCETPEAMQDALARFLANVALSTEVQKAEDEGQPRAQVTISTIHAAKGLEWPVVFIPAVYDGSIPHSRAEDADEERRLLYVAMTRAQALLYLSCPHRDSTGSQTTLSPFLSERLVRNLFAETGPPLRSAVVHDLATIVRRPCPPTLHLEKAYAGAEHVDDDQWCPRKRHDVREGGYDDYDDDEGNYNNDDGDLARVDQSRFSKRPRREDRFKDKRGLDLMRPVRSYSGPTTMSTMSHFASAAPFSKNGFTTAKKTLQAQSHAAYEPQQKAGDWGPPLSSTSKPPPRKSKPSDAVAGQSDISSFFQHRRPVVQDGRPTVMAAQKEEGAPEPLRDISNVVAAAAADAADRTTSTPQQRNRPAGRTLGTTRRSPVGWSALAHSSLPHVAHAQPGKPSGLHTAFKVPTLHGQRKFMRS